MKNISFIVGGFGSCLLQNLCLASILLFQGPLACVAIGYKTTEEQPTWYRLRNPDTGEQSFPDDISGHCLLIYIIF